MKTRKGVRAIAGIALCAAGFGLVFTRPLHPHTFLMDAGGCRMVTDVVEPAGGAAKGFVLLLHGLAANKKIMSYITSGFAEQGLRVFVPDLPGHGRTAGPFSPERAVTCSESLLRELIARGLIEQDRTILAGHSLGGAIAVRVANHTPVAGVIAISPAPMRTAHGVREEDLLFKDSAPAPSNSLLISGAWEPKLMSEHAADLAASREDGSAKYLVIPRATHASLLFNSLVVRESQKWVANLLHLGEPAGTPTRRGALGSAAGFIGLLLLAAPFLRETLRNKEFAGAPAALAAAPGTARLFLEFILLGLGTVAILHSWIPLRKLQLFEGDYFGSFLLILGAGLLLFHARSLRELFGNKIAAAQTVMRWLSSLFAACFAAFVLLLLFTAWLDLSMTEAWLTASRWARFPVLLAALLPYHAAEELVLCPAQFASGLRRLVFALLLRLAAWGTLLAGLFGLRSGEILLLLFAPYFALFCLLQRRGMDIVRKETASPAAAALFGAILFAGLCLVIFPIT